MSSSSFVLVIYLIHTNFVVFLLYLHLYLFILFMMSKPTLSFHDGHTLYFCCFFCTIFLRLHFVNLFPLRFFLFFISILGVFILVNIFDITAIVVVTCLVVALFFSLNFFSCTSWSSTQMYSIFFWFTLFVVTLNSMAAAWISLGNGHVMVLPLICVFCFLSYCSFSHSFISFVLSSIFSCIVYCCCDNLLNLLTVLIVVIPIS